ncbi:hypothetical protein BLGT_05925 [Bifidobacterium longum subsp. longum GT15]|nr:hypothetical protein BLGT_05925 [Bifidobacterium longum subsp. longum GT15]
MVRTMSESMMRRVAGRCGAHRLQAPSGARFHGSAAPRVHGFRAWKRPFAGGEAGEGPFPCPEPVKASGSYTFHQASEDDLDGIIADMSRPFDELMSVQAIGDPDLKAW